MAFPLMQVLRPGTRGFLLLHSGTLLPVLVPGPLANEVLGDILPHSPRAFYSGTPCAFIPGHPQLRKKKVERLLKIKFYVFFCLHQSMNIFPRSCYFAEYEVLTARLANTKLPGFRLLWCVTVYVIGRQNCPTGRGSFITHLRLSRVPIISTFPMTSLQFSSPEIGGRLTRIVTMAQYSSHRPCVYSNR